VVLLVRFRPGVIGATRRLVHVVPVAGELTARCGATLDRELVELVDGPRGLPCTACLLNTPGTGPEMALEAPSEA
jgi:hypothetical protein